MTKAISWSQPLQRHERIVMGPAKGKNANQIERISGIWQRFVYYFKGYTSDLSKIHTRLHSVALGKSDLLLNADFVARFNQVARDPKPKLADLSTDHTIHPRNLDANGQYPRTLEGWKSAIEAGDYIEAIRIDSECRALNPASCNVPWSALISEPQKVLGILRAIQFANKDATANNFHINDRLSEGGQTLLLWAAENGHNEIVDELLKFKFSGLHLHRTGPDGKTALRLALEKAHQDNAMAKQPLSEGTEVPEDPYQVIAMALLPLSEGTEVLDNGQTLLHAAAIGGNKDLIAQVLQKHPDLLLLLDADGQNAAHIAAQNGHTDALIALGNNPLLLCQQDKKGKVPVALAVENGKLDAAKAIGLDDKLQQRLSKLKDANGRTLAHTLAEKGDPALIKMYKNINYTQVDRHGITPVHLACQRVGTAPIDAILASTSNEALALQDNLGNTPLIYALKAKQPGLALHLINTRVDDKKLLAKSPALIELAAESGSLDLVEALWTKEVSVVTGHAARDRNTTALHVAAEHGHAAIINFLLDQQNSEVELALKTLYHGKSPLHAAINSDLAAGEKLAVAIPLTKKAIVLDADGETALTAYAKNLRTDGDQFLKQLIEHEDIDVKALTMPNKHGDTALHILARKGYWHLANILLKKVPELAKVKNKEKCTFLHEAFYTGQREFLHNVAKQEHAELAGGRHGKTILQLAQIARDHVLRSNLGDNIVYKLHHDIARDKIRNYIGEKYDCPFADLPRTSAAVSVRDALKEYNKDKFQLYDLEDFSSFASDEIRAKNWDRVRAWAAVGVIPKGAAELIVLKDVEAFINRGRKENITKDKKWDTYLKANTHLSPEETKQLRDWIENNRPNPVQGT